MPHWPHRIVAFVVFAVLLAGCATIPPDAPSRENDDFADRYVLSGPSGTVTGSNLDATLEAGEPFELRSTVWLRSVWWSWTAPASGAYAFDTVGSGFDTVLGVYTGNVVTALEVVGENDDAPGLSLRSRVAFEAVGGTTYHVAVGSWASSSSGAITLNWGPVD